MSGSKSYKSRFTVKHGAGFISVDIGDTAYFLTEFKLTFIVTKSGKKYTIDNNLTELEQQLDPGMFFRINRKYLVSINAIKCFQPFFKGKLKIELLPAVNEKVIVSQEKASNFKIWLES